MKTKEQVQNEVNTYLTKTSQHVFSSFGGNKYFRVVETVTIDGDKIWFVIWLDKNLEPNSIDRSYDITWYSDPNTKCVIKHSLFLNKGMESVKLKKKTQWVVDALVDAVKDLPKPPMSYTERKDYMETLINRLKVIKEG
ncbi:MAG: hypothetical protein ABFD07_17620 [Methanobacterium sp.]